MSFDIFEISGLKSGVVAICPLPTQDNELEQIKMYDPNFIVSMTETNETPNCNLEDMFKILAPSSEWIHLPTPDFSTPKENYAVQLDLLADRFNNGARIIIHCMGGCGRSGMVALRLLISQGEEGKQALARLRKIRECAVETIEQETWANLKT